MCLLLFLCAQAKSQGIRKTVQSQTSVSDLVGGAVYVDEIVGGAMVRISDDPEEVSVLH